MRSALLFIACSAASAAFHCGLLNLRVMNEVADTRRGREDLQLNLVLRTPPPPRPPAEPMKLETRPEEVDSAKAPPADPEPVPEETPAPPEAVLSAEELAGVEQARSTYWDAVRRRVQSRMCYPASARRRGVQGRVVLKVSVDRNGALVHASAETGDGDVLARSALSAVRRAAPFPPLVPEMQPGPAAAELPVRFEFGVAH